MKQIKVKKNDVSNSDHHDGVNLYHQKRTRRLSVSSMCLKTRNLGIQEKDITISFVVVFLDSSTYPRYLQHEQYQMISHNNEQS